MVCSRVPFALINEIEGESIMVSVNRAENLTNLPWTYILALVAAMTFTGLVYWQQDLQHEAMNRVAGSPEQVAKNESALKQCLADKPHCEGGFIKTRGGPVRRISSCNLDCNFYEVGFGPLEIWRSSPSFLADIELIALPSDETGWNKANREHGRQFVRK